MAGNFDWVKTELKKMKLFRFPSGHNGLKGAQFALLKEHHEAGTFPLPTEVRKSLRDVWISRQEHEGRPVVLVHALALAESPVERHADNLDVQVTRLRDRFREAGIKATFHLNTFSNSEEPHNHIQQYTGTYYAPLAQHVSDFGLSMPGLHSIVMRLEAAPEATEGRLEEALGSLKEWKAQATLESLRSRIRKRVIGKRKTTKDVVTARIANRTEAERLRDARRRRAAREITGQLRFPFMQRPSRRIVA